MFGFTRFQNGLQLIPQNTGQASIAGEMSFNSSTNTFEFFDTALHTFSGSDTSETLTNKTISGSNNTLLNIPSGQIVFSGSAIPISVGGTGQVTQTTAFDALSPLTTKGDLIVYNGTHNIRLPVGTDSQVLTADSTQPSGFSYTNSTVANNSITEFKLTTSVAGNGLTGGNGTPLSVVVDGSTLQITSNTLSVKPLGITASDIANNTITATQIASQTITATQIANTTITASQIANNTITATQIVNGTLTGTQITPNVNLSGTSVRANSQNVVVSNTNATNSLAIVRVQFSSSGGLPQTGEGATCVNNSTGIYTVTWNTGFNDTPVVVASALDDDRAVSVSSVTGGSCVIGINISTSGTVIDGAFQLIAIGQVA